MDFLKSALMQMESPWPPSYMLKHSIPLQAIFKDLLSSLSKLTFDLKFDLEGKVIGKIYKHEEKLYVKLPIIN